MYGLGAEAKFEPRTRNFECRSASAECGVRNGECGMIIHFEFRAPARLPAQRALQPGGRDLCPGGIANVEFGAARELMPNVDGILCISKKHFSQAFLSIGIKSLDVPYGPSGVNEPIAHRPKTCAWVFTLPAL